MDSTFDLCQHLSSEVETRGCLGTRREVAARSVVKAGLAL